MEVERLMEGGMDEQAALDSVEEKRNGLSLSSLGEALGKEKALRRNAQ